MECAEVLLSHLHHENPIIALRSHAGVSKAQDLAKAITGQVALASAPLPAPRRCLLPAQQKRHPVCGLPSRAVLLEKQYCGFWKARKTISGRKNHSSM